MLFQATACNSSCYTCKTQQLQGPLGPRCRHIHSLSHRNTPSHTHSHTLMWSHSHTYSHQPTLSHTHTHVHSLAHTHTDTLSCSTHSHALFSHSHTHAQTPSLLTNTLPHTCCLTNTHSFTRILTTCPEE